MSARRRIKSLGLLLTVVGATIGAVGGQYPPTLQRCGGQWQGSQYIT